MFNYDEPSRIFPCILLTRNHMIFLVQFGINKHLLIFSKTTNCTSPTGSCNFVSLWKNLLVLIYSKLRSKSCDYLYKTLLFSLYKMARCLLTDVKRLLNNPRGIGIFFFSNIHCLTQRIILENEDCIWSNRSQVSRLGWNSNTYHQSR